MLSELQVKNFAIIDDLQLSFRSGLNIISGETGAGKSILLKSLGLLMGAKASPDMIRPGQKQALIEGLFDLKKRPDIIQRLEQLGIDCDEKTLVVKRVISSQSKSKTYLNSSLSTLNDLASIVSPLVEVTSNATPLIELTSQHESKSLLTRAYHQQVLDQYGMCSSLRQEYSDYYYKYQKLQEDLENFKNRASENQSKLDYLVFQQQEIKSLNLQENEEQELESAYNQIRHAKKIQENILALESLIWSDSEGALARLHTARGYLSKLCDIDANYFQNKLNSLDEVTNLLDEIAFQTQSYIQNEDFHDMNIQSIEERLSQLRKLQKKYGNRVEDILSALQNIEKEIHEIENFDVVVKEKEEEIEKLYKKLKNLATQLSKTRHNASQVMTASVNEELKDLNMKGLKFHVSIQKRAELGKNGMDDIEFMCQQGKNTQARSLAKTASGGELSRILLALKNVIGASEIARTYLFDEVDSGISGETAEKVGRKLQQISRGQQVICVTHLPQVASFADIHFFIEKDPKAKKVKMQAKELNQQERALEIARLISGEKISKTSLAHAKELLKEAQSAY